VDQNEIWRGGRPRPQPHCVRWGTSSPMARDTAPHFSAHVCCGQTIGWIKMPLGTEVDLGPVHIVLDGDPASPAQKGHSSPLLFSPCLLWPNGRPFRLLLNTCLKARGQVLSSSRNPEESVNEKMSTPPDCHSNSSTSHQYIGVIVFITFSLFFCCRISVK